MSSPPSDASAVSPADRPSPHPAPAAEHSGPVDADAAPRAGDELRAMVTALSEELITFRRDLHVHPELGRSEYRTTGQLVNRLEAAGLTPRVLPGGTGLTCDIHPQGGSDQPLLALRADIDALPVPDAKDVPYRSSEDNVTHACGHDVHTSVLLGAGLVLAELARAGRLPRPVRLLFQPAEEQLPGGALDVIEAGGLDGVASILALHCDPKVELGRIGWRTGSITSACDRIVVSLDGPGGHTARPHLTCDLVGAVGAMASQLPAALRGRIDPRFGLNLVWGRIESGQACNAVPQHAEIEGTVRCLELAGWRQAPELVHELVEQLAAPYGAKWELDYHRGVPPVVNEPSAMALLRDAMTERFGDDAVEDTAQSLGGEDFSWYLQHVPGAMARLGVRSPADPTVRDIHQGSFDVDERAIGVGAELFVAAALRG